MTALVQREQDGALKRGRRWGLISLMATLVATVVISFCLLLWSQATSAPHVADKMARFAGLMNVVRPLLLFVLLMLWRPAFSWLHDRALVADETHRKAITIWPRLMVWTGLIELTIGQGYLLFGLGVTAVYWFVWRLK